MVQPAKSHKPISYGRGESAIISKLVFRIHGPLHCRCIQVKHYEENKVELLDLIKNTSSNEDCEDLPFSKASRNEPPFLVKTTTTTTTTTASMAVNLELCK